MQQLMKRSESKEDIVIDQNQVLIKDLASIRHEFEKFKRFYEAEITYLKLSNMALGERVHKLEIQLEEAQTKNGLKNSFNPIEKKLSHPENNEIKTNFFVPQVKNELNFKIMDTENENNDDESENDEIKCESKQ